jgi:hypothetical protein
MKSRVLFAIGFGLLPLLASTAQASYLYPWPAEPTLTDPDDDLIGDEVDILGMWHAYENGYHHFRLDLQADPTTNIGSHADLYGIYMDFQSGGGQNSSTIDYIPSSLTGIDAILDSHLDVDGTWEKHDYHYWHIYGGWGAFELLDSSQAQQSENGGTTLEFRVKNDLLKTPITIWGASFDFGGDTYDITEPLIVVPEPATGMLLLSAALGLGIRRRRSA